jgi:hypothetical protein
MIRPILHIVLHFIVPILVARRFYKTRWQWAYVIMMATMIVDLDHLLAQPIYDPNRCGIGFHPLHSYPAIAAYALALAVPRLRLVAIGLLIHMGLDWSDCWCVYWGI